MKKSLIALAVFATVGISVPTIASAWTLSPSVDTPAAQALSTPTSFSSKPKAGTKAKCPVLGNVFTVKAGTAISHYKGRYYAFCCPGCKPKFDATPSKYAGR